MITQLKCSQGHSWDPGSSSNAPLVCPTCGRPPLTSSASAPLDSEATIDLPARAPANASAANSVNLSELTQTMEYTPQSRPAAPVAGPSAPGPAVTAAPPSNVARSASPSA